MYMYTNKSLLFFYSTLKISDPLLKYAEANNFDIHGFVFEAKTEQLREPK